MRRQSPTIFNISLHDSDNAAGAALCMASNNHEAINAVAIGVNKNFKAFGKSLIVTTIFAGAALGLAMWVDKKTYDMKKEIKYLKEKINKEEE